MTRMASLMRCTRSSSAAPSEPPRPIFVAAAVCGARGGAGSTWGQRGVATQRPGGRGGGERRRQCALRPCMHVLKPPRGCPLRFSLALRRKAAAHSQAANLGAWTNAAENAEVARGCRKLPELLRTQFSECRAGGTCHASAKESGGCSIDTLQGCTASWQTPRQQQRPPHVHHAPSPQQDGAVPCHSVTLQRGDTRGECSA